MQEKIARMKELTALLSEAAKAYYQESREIMSNFEYDRLYDELLALEAETGVILAGSPTQRVGYEVLSELPKEAHPSPMLSLDKTKDVGALQEWLGGQEGVLSWKLDGLTVVLTYENGRLQKAVTRGNGEIGEVITNNARVFENLPLQIAYRGRLVLRGEAVIRYSDFERMNAEIADVDAKYKNPRNLCSGSVRQLNSEVTANRHVNCIIFALVQASDEAQQIEGMPQQATDKPQLAADEPQQASDEPRQIEGVPQRAADESQQIAGMPQPAAGEPSQVTSGPAVAGASEDLRSSPVLQNSVSGRFAWLRQQGFEVVEHMQVTAETLPDAVAHFAHAIENYDIPSDGLVLTYEDIAYGESLGRTAKFPRNSIAFKWADEIAETTLSEIEWSPSRTGLINPVAVFEPVELEGTTVSRASVHNISIMEGLALGVGDRITVYKANMIIPQIADNLTRSGVRDIPKICPVCGGDTVIRQENDVKSLYCVNPDCQAKKIKSFTLFVSRDALNIDGLSEMTLEKFIGAGFIHEFADIFHLDRHRDAIVEMEGFGQKSYDNLIQAVERASHTTLVRVVYGLGVAGIGLANAKVLCRKFNYDFEKMRRALPEELQEADGIGEVLADAWCGYFASAKNNAMVDRLLAELDIEEAPKSGEEAGGRPLAGKTFVITGTVEHFANRKALQELIEARGGKAAGSVTAKTTYLINNDVTSSSTKNKKARELGIPILSEEDFLKLLDDADGI